MNADDIAASINAGDYDSDLEALFKALFARAAIIETNFSWKITLDGDSWTRETVTLAELGQAERLTGIQSYTQLNPVQSADHLVALIISHLHRVNGMTVAGAIKAAGKYTATDLADIISIHEVKKAPKDNTGEPESS